MNRDFYVFAFRDKNKKKWIFGCFFVVHFSRHFVHDLTSPSSVFHFDVSQLNLNQVNGISQTHSRTPSNLHSNFSTRKSFRITKSVKHFTRFDNFVCVWRNLSIWRQWDDEKNWEKNTQIIIFRLIAISFRFHRWKLRDGAKRKSWRGRSSVYFTLCRTPNESTEIKKKNMLQMQSAIDRIDIELNF